MRQLFAFVFAVVGIAAAVVMFTLKTTSHPSTSGWFGTTQHVHPGWATAVGIVFLLVGLVLAAVLLVTPQNSAEPVE